MKNLNTKNGFIFLFLITLIYFFISGYKQINRKEEYAVAIVRHRVMSNKVTVTIDFGQKRPFLAENRATDKDGNIIIFNSAVDVMNYMNEDGWFFMNSDIIPQGNTYEESLFFARQIN